LQQLEKALEQPLANSLWTQALPAVKKEDLVTKKRSNMENHVKEQHIAIGPETMYSSNKECIENEERPLMLPETPAGCL
jgi:hypothetical protein